jgi:hypothetical protein
MGIMGKRVAAWGVCVVIAAIGCGGPDAPDVEAERGALFRPVPGSCASDDLTVVAATASGVENDHFRAGLAVDGNVNTRWSSGPAASAWLALDLGKRVMIRGLVIDWERAFSPSFWVQASDDAVNWATIEVAGARQAGEQSLPGLDTRARYLRILSRSPSTFGNVSIWEVTVFGDPNVACLGVPARCGATVLLPASRAQASSTEFSYTPAAAAVDGVYSTRWSSPYTDNEWLAIDLGGTARIDWVTINWEHAFARRYALQTGASLTGPWTTVTTVDDGQFGSVLNDVGATSRYLRLLGLARATQYGYSTWEVEVYGSRATTCP